MDHLVDLPLAAGGWRRVTLVEGPAGWGEVSFVPGYPCPPDRARAAAEEAAYVGWPAGRRSEVAVNALWGTGRVDGFGCVKVKVGDAGSVDRVAQVRDSVGPHVAIRVDANGVWDVETAVEEIARLAAYDLELVEQPVASLDDLAAVRRRVDVPIAADECVRSVDDARRLAAIGAADVVVLKVQPLGGVRAALEVADAAGVPAIVTSMMETSVGLAAGLALGAALPDLPFACGLGTAAVWAADVVPDPLIPVGGRLTVRRPVPDPDLLARYRAAA